MIVFIYIISECLGDQLKLRGRLLGRLELFGLQCETGALVEINPSLGCRAVRMVLRYLIFERVARFPRRVEFGYPQDVTKLPEEGLAIGPFGSADRRLTGD